MARIPIGLQLYSVREDCARDLPGTLAAVAKMGYQGVECAVKAMAGQKPAARIPTDAVVVTRDNVDSPEIQKVLNPPTK